MPNIGISREYQRALIDLMKDLLDEPALDPDVQLTALWLRWKLEGRSPVSANVQALAA